MHTLESCDFGLEAGFSLCFCLGSTSFEEVNDGLEWPEDGLSFSWVLREDLVFEREREEEDDEEQVEQEEDWERARFL